MPELKTASLVVCRRASDALLPGCTTGYQCRWCQKELQVSAAGRKAIEAGAWPVCNPCGLYASRHLRDKASFLDLSGSPHRFADFMRKVNGDA